MFRERSRAFDGRKYRSIREKTTKAIAFLELRVTRDRDNAFKKMTKYSRIYEEKNVSLQCYVKYAKNILRYNEKCLPSTVICN